MEEKFIKWYEEEAMRYSTSEIGQFYPYIDMKKLIDKIVIWYELKYNSDLIEKRDNPNEQVFTTELLLNALPWFQRIYFYKTRYVNMVKMWKDKSIVNINLDAEGHVVSGENSRYLVDNLLGMSVEEVIELVSDNNLGYNVSNLEKAIVNYRVQEEIKRKLMEVIIERMVMSTDKYGLKRAFMFVKDFHLDPGILDKYLDKCGDWLLVERINEYKKNYSMQDDGEKLCKKVVE